MKLSAFIMAIYLLVGSCFPKGDFTQFLRLAELSQHYRLHIEESASNGREVSFLRFLQMHYTNTQAHESNEEHDHHNLPFHQINSSFDQIIPLSWTMTELTPPGKEKSAPVSFCSFYLQDFPNSIFHPPIV